MDNTAETDDTSSEKNLTTDPGPPQPKPKASKRTRARTRPAKHRHAELSTSSETEGESDVPAPKKPRKQAKVPYHKRTAFGIHRVKVTELELSLIRKDYPWIKHEPFAVDKVKGCKKSIMILPEELDRLQALRKSTKGDPVKLKGHKFQKKWEEVVKCNNDRHRAWLAKRAKKAKKAAGQEDWVVFFGQKVQFKKV